MKSRRGAIRRGQLGYSLIEMVMTLAVGLILVSVALPVLVGAIQSYRLNSIAQQTADLVALARYTAIRRNSVVSVLLTPDNTTLFVDVNGNGKLDTRDPMVMLPSDMQIVNSGAPSAVPSTGLKNPQNFAGTITFDYRGTVNFPSAGTIAPYFLVLAYTNPDQYGFRAISVIPMGQTKIWTAPKGGPWTGM
jgi:prepilin-type N-terminal cleavage/methylation domain-containing protein